MTPHAHIVSSNIFPSAKCRRPGVGANFVILKYFYDRDPFWQGIRNEGARVNDDPEIQPEEQDLDPSSTDIHFDPIDSRHLSSLDLVRSRIVKLLKAQERQMFLCTNILVALVGLCYSRTLRLSYKT